MSGELQRRKDQAAAEKLAKRGHELQRGLAEDCKAIRTRGWLAGEKLNEIIESRLWENLGYEHGQAGLTDFLAEPPIELSYGHAQRLAKMHREIVQVRGVSLERLEGIDPQKVEVALPAIKDGKADLDEVIDRAATNSRSDMLAEFGNSEVTPSEDKVRCESCGSLVDPAKVAA